MNGLVKKSQSTDIWSDFDSLLAGFGSMLESWFGPRNTLFPPSPTSVISENETEYRVIFTVPGFKKKELAVEFNPVTNKILVTAEKSDKTSKFSGSASWNGDMDVSKANATLEDGVLTIVIPKVSENQKKKTTIPVG